MIELPPSSSMSEYQRYIHELERLHGWLDVDLVHNCFLMGEEVGELFKAIRRHQRLFDQEGSGPLDRRQATDQVAEELVDVLNYLLAIANRLEIDLERAFRAKNELNQSRSWGPSPG